MKTHFNRKMLNIMNKNTYELLKEDPKRLFQMMADNMLLMWMPDSLFLKISYRLKLNKKLNLDKPKSFIAVFNNTAERTLIFEKK